MSPDESRQVVSNMGLVRVISRSYLGRGIDKDDLFQMGCMGLIRAVQTFDPSKGIPFGSYAAILIKQSIFAGLKQDTRAKKDINRAITVGVYDRFGDWTDVETIAAEEGAEHLHHEMRRLPERERSILESRYGLGGRIRETQGEIGRRMGYTRQRICQIEAEALGLLRQFYGVAV